MKKTKQELSKMRAEIGRRGGNQTKKRGKEYYSKIGKAGIAIRWAKRKQG